MVQQKEPNLEAKILNVGASQGLVQVSWHRYDLRVICLLKHYGILGDIWEQSSLYFLSTYWVPRAS